MQWEVTDFVDQKKIWPWKFYYMVTKVDLGCARVDNFFSVGYSILVDKIFNF